MPGIFGLITSKPREWAEPQLLRMLKLLRHESFYVTGTWIDEASGVYVGWTARENSFSDGMPVQNERGDVTLVFSGEEYPEPSTAQGLKERGHQFKAGGASYLVHLYEDDPSFPKTLNGRFQGLLSDRTRGVATLFNDRYSMHRLYYHEAKDAFYFAVEAKAILAVRPELRRPDPAAWGNSLRVDACSRIGRSSRVSTYCLPGQPGLFGPDQSRPRRLILIRASGNTKTCWIRNPITGNPGYFRAPFPALPQRPRADRRITDRRARHSDSDGLAEVSTEIAALLYLWRHRSRMSRRGGGAPDRPGMPAAHQVIPVGDEFFARFPSLRGTQRVPDGCCVEVTRAPDLYLSERAREIAPVRMTGLYGDEIQRPQTRAFKPVDPAPGLYSSRFSPTLKRHARLTRDSFRDIRPLFLRFDRRHGTTTAFCRWSRHNWRCEHHSLITTSCALRFAHPSR
jgi:asparagine synthase (glutamine-hydrolysing)